METESEKIESFETPSAPDNEVASSGESPFFSLIAVLIMVLVLIGGGYYFLHNSGAAKAISNFTHAQISPSQ